jgi:hypothetical protein
MTYPIRIPPDDDPAYAWTPAVRASIGGVNDHQVRITALEAGGGGGTAITVDGTPVATLDIDSTALDLAGDAATKSDLRRLLAIGDSMTQGDQDGTGYGYPGLAAGSLGDDVTVINRGQGGFTSTEIAISHGAIDPVLGAFTIPADTSATAVTVTAPTAAFRNPGTGGETFTYTGVIAGIPGVLTRSPTADTWTFARTTAGSATPVAAGATFHCTRDDNDRDALTVIWVGRNNVATSASPIVQSDIAAMVAHLTPTVARYLVMGVCPGILETTGTQGHTNILALNAALAVEYGDRYIDLRTTLMAGLSLVNITPTGADTTAIANGTIPPSLLHPDGLHFNQWGYRVVAHAVKERLRALDWLTAPTRAVHGTGLINLRANPDFASASAVNSVGDPNTNLVFTRTAGVGRGNSFGCRVTFSGATTGNGIGFYQDGLNAGTVYSGSLWVRPSKVVTLLPRILRWTDAFAGFAAGQYNGAGRVCLPGVWTKLALTGTITGGTIFGILAANDAQGWTAADYIDFDDIQIVAGSVAL